MRYLSLFFLYALLGTSTVNAQMEGRNMAKINLSAFALKGFNVQYERQIAKRWTAALGYSAIPKSTIAFKSVLDKQVNDVDINFGDMRLGTSIFTPEIRYYVGKRGAFHGFYLAPYARISSYDMDGPISIFSGIDRRTVIFSGKLNAVTGGLMLGSNFRLSDRLHLDWWIIGAGFGGANGNLVAATSLSEMEQRELRRELENLEVPMTRIQSQVNANGATITTTGSMAGIRGLGLNLGIRF
ncbi:DUF3575 domain-containing protein [Aridibaculum aurantiacum]|uniref:DUF3575 domain-containing protein n=1 Tax=Aridibaculum aurantiacum TaxID=2810307 RepID=UPI001A973AF2|nr:DUF3575 domain-containing protein [Aridibaculum aurantiacum]